jgi:sarcosine oxidase
MCVVSTRTRHPVAAPARLAQPAGEGRGAAGADVGVVGAGIVGLAAVDALVRAGASVCVYERARPGAGQSGGRTRIFRHGHAEPHLVALARRSRAAWREWEARFGRALVRPHGVLAAGPRVPGRHAMLLDAGVRSRLLCPEEQLALLPLLREPFPGRVALDEDGGPIDVEAALDALAGAHAARLRTAEVLALRATRAGTAEVVTEIEVAEHGAVVVCAGRETAALAAGAGLELPVSLSAHLRATFAAAARGPRPGACPTGEPGRTDGPDGTGTIGATTPPLPCLLDGSGAHGEAVYGSPLPDGRHYGIGLSGGDAPARPDGALHDPAALAMMRERVEAYVERALPGLDPRAVATRACWVTELPWSGDAFAAWSDGPLHVFAGQNLFKHAPVLGEALAALALEGTAPEILRAPESAGAARV